MLSITNEFRPYRMKISRKEPVKMRLTISNGGSAKALASYQMALPSSLSLDRSGLRSAYAKRIGELEPGKNFTEHFELHPRPLTRAGTHAITVRATEHYNSYDFVQKDYVKKLELIIED